MSNLAGLNVAYVIPNTSNFTFKFELDDEYGDETRYKMYICFNNMRIMNNYHSSSTAFESGLTEEEKNSITLSSISSDSTTGIWRYKDIRNTYIKMVGCYTSTFNKSLQPNTLFITIPTGSGTGSIHLGNIKIVG
jgi:hypothetical protein